MGDKFNILIKILIGVFYKNIYCFYKYDTCFSLEELEDFVRGFRELYDCAEQLYNYIRPICDQKYDETHTFLLENMGRPNMHATGVFGGLLIWWFIFYWSGNTEINTTDVYFFY